MPQYSLFHIDIRLHLGSVRLIYVVYGSEKCGIARDQIPTTTSVKSDDLQSTASSSAAGGCDE